MTLADSVKLVSTKSVKEIKLNAEEILCNVHPQQPLFGNSFPSVTSLSLSFNVIIKIRQ